MDRGVKVRVDFHALDARAGDMSTKRSGLEAGCAWRSRRPFFFFQISRILTRRWGKVAFRMKIWISVGAWGSG